MTSPLIIVGSSARPFVAKATRARAAHARVTASRLHPQQATNTYRVMAAEHPEFACVAPSEAAKLVQAGVTFLDVRTPEEFAKGTASTPTGAVNVPVRLTSDSKDINPRFVKEVQERFGLDTPLVTSCYGGGRGGLAAGILHAAGFTAITNLVGGLGAWTKEGLPTTAVLERPAGH